MNKFIVRNINNTPAKRLNKKNTNKYYFDVYDSNAKKIFYADTLSFNHNNKEFIHRLAMDNEMTEINFKKEILFFKFRNFFLRPTN